MAQRSVELGSFAPGVNNRLEPTQLATTLPDRTRGQYLYGASNVDLNEKGYLKRRAGLTAQASGQSHSLWADAAGAYVVHGGDLCAYTPPNSFATVVAGVGNQPVSFSRGADDEVYWSNTQLLRRISGGTDRPVVTEPPNAVPGITVGAGALPAGTYLVATTIVSVDGESPATPVVAVQVPLNSSITVAGSQTVCVYMSAPDGDILTLQGAGSTVTVATFNQNGRRCMTLNRAVMPPGQIVRHYRGSLLVASGSVLYVSDPYNYGVHNPSKGYIPFPARVDIVEPMDNGVWICADRTYWIGNLFEDVLQEVYPFGAVPGTSGRSPNAESVFWQSQRGLVIADKNMGFKNVQEDALQFPESASGASVYREKDGMTHILTTRYGVDSSNAAATSFMEAEIIRKGTIL